MGRGGGSGSGSGGGGGHFHYGGGRGGGSSSHRSSSSSSYNHSYGGYRRRSSNVYIGRFNTNWIFVILIVMALIRFSTVLFTGNPAIQKSTIEREVLPAGKCTPIGTWYEDSMPDRWIYNTSEVEKGLKYFYKKTGVQPYLWITDNLDGKAKPTQTDFEAAMPAKYNTLFKDQGHLLVCFLESSPSVYATYYWAGSDAERVMDSEAGEILLDTLDYHYSNGDLSDEEFFSKSFKETANRIMKVQKTTKQIVFIAVIVVALAVGIALAVVYVLKKKEKDAQDAAERERILNTDIDAMADSVLNKYDKEK